MATTVFRVAKNQNYTVISNYHLQDRTLSNKAKGLLTIMLSLPPSWDMTLKGLVSLSADGTDAIRAQLSELEKHGYLTRTRSRDELGRLQCTEYTIYEQPIEPENTNEFSKENIQTGKSDVDRNAAENAENSERNTHMGKSDVDQIGFSNIGKPNIGKSHPIKYLTNKDTYSINNLSHQSKSQSDFNNQSLRTDDEMDRIKASELTQKRKQYEDRIKDNIEYDALTSADDDDEFTDFVDMAVDIMTDVCTSNNAITHIGGQEYPTEAVKSNLLKITDENIEYVYNSIKESNRPIKNMRSYILTALYFSLHGESLKISQAVKGFVNKRGN